MSHEQSITVKLGRKHVNIPTVSRDANRKRKLTNQQAIRQAADTGHVLSAHDTLDAALKAAEHRSQSFNRALPYRQSYVGRKKR